MDLRPRWSLYYQMTLAAVLITAVAVFVVGTLAIQEGEKTLLDHEMVDLGDETNLRSADIEADFLRGGRGLREITTALRVPLGNLSGPDGTLTGDPSVHPLWGEVQKAWDKEIASRIRPESNHDVSSKEGFDGLATERFSIVRLAEDRVIEIGGSNVIGGISDEGYKRGEALVASSAATNLIQRVIQNPGANHPYADSTGFVLESDSAGGLVCRLYLARRLTGKSEKDNTFQGLQLAILVRLNVTHYFADLCRRSPRHAYFLVSRDGVYLYHPNSNWVGKNLGGDGDALDQFPSRTWGTTTTAFTSGRGFRLKPADASPGLSLPDIWSFHAKRRMPTPREKDSSVLYDAFNKELAQFASAPENAGLRYSELSQGSTRLEISHTSNTGLERAKKEIDRILSLAVDKSGKFVSAEEPGEIHRWGSVEYGWGEAILAQLGAPGKSWYETILCQKFILHVCLQNTGLGSALAQGDGGSSAVEVNEASDRPKKPQGDSPLQADAARLIVGVSVEEIYQDVNVTTKPRVWLGLILVTVAATGLMLGLSLYVCAPLSQIAESARNLAGVANKVAQNEIDPNKSGEHFVVSLPTFGPQEVREVSAAFREMVGQIERMTERLKRRTAEIDAVLRTAPDAILMFGEQGEIEVANPAADQMFGYPPGGLAGVTVQSLLRLMNESTALTDGAAPAPTDSLSTHDQVSRVIGVSSQEVRAVRSDRSEFWAETSFTKVDLRNRILYTGIFRDVTQRREAQDEIHRVNGELAGLNAELEHRVAERTARLELALAEVKVAAAAKDTFVANMSHELRSPLSTIIGYTEAMREEAVDEDNQTIIPDLDRILTSANHLLAIINDILDRAKIEAGKLELMRDDFALVDLVKAVRTLTEPLAAKNGNALQFPTEPDLGRMIGDERRVRQILLNLLSNSSKFTSHGTVSLVVKRDEGWVTFTVTDTGKGMTQEQCARLFERFYQADDSTRRQQGGTGIGLAITRGLIDLMGGTIKVKSEVGVGSTFTVRLPAELATGRGDSSVVRPMLPPAARTTVDSNGKNEKNEETVASSALASDAETVLVIDDDAGVQDLMRRFLEKDGFRVLTAGTGEEGLAMAKAHCPSVVTLDVMMPGVDGWATLAALKTDATTCNIPVVMITMVDDSGRGFTLGATDYLTKPINWQVLASTLRNYSRSSNAGPVLIIDDDAEQRELLTRLLTKTGRAVVTANNGKEALERLAEARPVLILLDLMMPVMDGFEFLAELYRRDPAFDVPVIVVTAKEVTPEEAKRLNGRVTQVVQKGNGRSLDDVFRSLRRAGPTGPGGRLADHPRC